MRQSVAVRIVWSKYPAREDFFSLASCRVHRKSVRSCGAKQRGGRKGSRRPHSCMYPHRALLKAAPKTDPPIVSPPFFVIATINNIACFLCLSVFCLPLGLLRALSLHINISLVHFFSGLHLFLPPPPNKKVSTASSHMCMVWPKALLCTS